MIVSPYDIFFIAGIFVVALLYSSVGHAGASGYIAVMALFGISATAIRPTALLLNIVVAVIATLQFSRSGFFRWNIFLPVAAASIPFAILGGYILPPHSFLKILLGIILLFSAARFFFTFHTEEKLVEPKIIVLLFIGAVIGLLSGITGVGGGIFLTPLLLFMSWSNAKTAAAVSAPFILVNSIAGLIGYSFHSNTFSHSLSMSVPSAAAGGIIGAYLGSSIFSAAIIKRILAVVLTVAGIKLIFT